MRPKRAALRFQFPDLENVGLVITGDFIMRQMSRRMAVSVMALAGAFAVLNGDPAGRAAWAAQSVSNIDARLIAINIPGASAVAQVGTFLNDPGACASPIPNLFPTYIQPGAVLDPMRILVGSRSNFGAPLATGVGQEGSFLSIDPTGPGTLGVPANFARSGIQASAHGGRVPMFSANSPHWLNSVNNPDANTKQYTGVSNPLGLSNNKAFGRIWPANAPFGDSGVGSSSILDPTALPLKGAPNHLIGGVLRWQLDGPRPSDLATSTSDHPRRADQGRSGDGLSRPIAGRQLQSGVRCRHRRRCYCAGANPQGTRWIGADGYGSATSRPHLGSANPTG